MLCSLFFCFLSGLGCLLLVLLSCSAGAFKGKCLLVLRLGKGEARGRLSLAALGVTLRIGYCRTQRGEAPQAAFLVIWQAWPVVEQGLSAWIGAWDIEMRQRGKARVGWSVGSIEGVKGEGLKLLWCSIVALWATLRTVSRVKDRMLVPFFSCHLLVHSLALICSYVSSF